MKESRSLEVARAVLFPPLVEAGENLFVIQNTLGTLQLKQPAKNVADVSAWTDTEVFHDCGAVDLGPFRGFAFLMGKIRDSRLEFVDRPLQFFDFMLVAGSAIGPDQGVESPQQGARLTGVAAYSSIRPTVGIALEATAQPDQFAYFLHDLFGVAEFSHAFSGHAGTDGFVMPESHSTVFEAASPGLGYIVKKRC